MVVTSEDLFTPPVPRAILGILVLCVTCVVISIVSSCRLAKRHFVKGQEISGSTIPTTRSVHVAKGILAIPLFSLFAVFGLLTPEAAPLWMFMLGMVTSHVMRKLPDIYVDAVGGTQKLVTDISAYASEPLKLYGNPPLCCILKCAPPKIPVPLDIRKLKMGIFQFCAIQPLLLFVELFLSIEMLHHVSYASGFAWRKPLMTVIKVLSNLVAMSSCSGYATLCEMANRNDQVEEGALAGKQSFVQSFIMGTNLFPALFHGLLSYFLHDITLHNGKVMKPDDQTLWATSGMICIASVYLAKSAYKAFPQDDPTLYPEGLNEPLL